ncbi:MAG: phosphonate metabolism transcriptional regulator PhnF [Rhodobacter sp.]|nr:phosphonate metabolism transcriptional regulator PhnF [Rhodobacter sp.]
MTRSPIWKAIAEALASDIAGGQYPTGSKLPTEADLSARFGVNRHTVRHALSALAAQGLVVPRRGAGVFVTAPATEYRIGKRVRFNQNIAATGRVPSRQISRLETCPATPPEAGALHLAAGTSVHVVEGLSLADGQPLALFRSVLPAARFPSLLDDLARTPSITAAMASGGLADYTRASTRLTARRADPVQALHLRLAEGAPLLQSVAVNVDGAGVPVEYGTTWFAGDRVTLTIHSDD